MRVLWSERKRGTARACSVSAAPRTYIVYGQIIACACVVILSKMAPGWRGGDELLNKVIIFVFFAHKKYSRNIVKLRLNYWCQMDYFNDVLITFLCLDCGRTLAVYGRVRKLSDFIKIYLNLCSEDEQRSYGFGTTWGWVIMTEFSFFGELSL